MKKRGNFAHIFLIYIVLPEDCETFVATKMKRNSVKEGVEIKKYYYVFMLHCLRFDKSLKRILNVMLEYHNKRPTYGHHLVQMKLGK